MNLFGSLRSLLVVLVIAAIAPLFGFSVFKAVLSVDEDLQQATQNLQDVGTAVAVTQERLADSARQLLVSISKVPKLADRKDEDCAGYFRGLYETLKVYTNIGIISADGKIICHSAPTGAGDYAGDRSYFQDAMTQGRFVASGYLVGRISKKPLIAFALPVTDAQGNHTAVVFAALHFGELAKAVADIKLPAGSHLVIMDRDGVVLAENVEKSTAIGKRVDNPLLQNAVTYKTMGMVEGFDSSGAQKIYAVLPTRSVSDSPFFIALGIDRDAVAAPARRQLTLELIVLLLVTGLGCLLAWIVGGRAIIKPALEVLEVTKEIQAGRFDVRIPIQPEWPSHELIQIADGVNQMADTLQEREFDLVTELRRSEQAWETLDLTVNSLQDGLITVDSDGRVVLVNEAASRMFALDLDITPLSSQWPELLGLFIPGTDRLYAMDELPLYKALQGQSGGPQHILVKNDVVPEGRLIAVRYRPMTDVQGEVGGLMVFSDITELYKLQQEQVKSYTALRESQRKLLDAQRLGRIGHWEIDQARQVISWSDEVYEIFGMAPNTFDGRNDTFLKMLHPDDVQMYTACRDDAVQRDAELDIEFRIITPAGEIRWMHQLGQTHFNRDGQAIYRAGVVQEITERKQAELSLARTAELLKTTGELAMVGGWEIDLRDMRLQYSDQMYRIHELPVGAPVNVDMVRKSYAPESLAKFEAAGKAAIKSGTPWDLELPLTTAGGRSIWVRTRGHAVREGDRAIKLVGALQDITAQHNAQEQLRLLETCVSRLNDIVLITEAEPISHPGPRIVFVNDAFERRTGYTREEVLGKSPRLLQGPKTQRSELDRIDAALKSWQPVRAELINYKKTGEEFWIELDIVPIANEQGWFTHWVAVERDITGRKLAEQAMHDSEQRYAALFEQAPVPMWLFDAETFRFLTVNDAAVRDYGYSVEEFLSMSIFDIRSEAEGQRLKKHIEQQSQDASRRWEHRRKDGSVFTVRGVSKPIQYAGKAAQFVISLDVSAQVKAEYEVNDYLTTLQRAAAATHAITLHLSVDGLMDEVAAQVRHVIGSHQAVVSLCSDDEWTHATHALSLSEKYTDDGLDCSQQGNLLSIRGVDVYASACDSTQVMRLTQAEIESHPGWLNTESFVHQRHTIRGWLAVPLVGRSGKNIGLLQLSDKYKGEFTLQDEYVATELAQLASIAIENAQLLEEVNQLNTGLEQKVADRTAALARQEALFRAVAEQAPQVIWTADTKGQITYGNRAWFDLMGGQMSDWDGLKWMTAVHAEDLPQVKANWALSVANQTPFSGVRRLLAKDGSYHVMSYRALPVLDAGGMIDFWVGIDSDVTEIKAVESALRLSNQELEAFSYSVSHDLRSPLNTVDGFSRLLSKQLGADIKDKERHYLSRIQAGVAQMGRLIEDLLSLAHVSRMQLQNEPIDLSAICQNLIEELHARHPDRDVTAHIEGGLHAHGDSGLIRIVLENLLGNAWKFTSHIPNATIRVGQTTDAMGLPVFFVADNGAGFDMAYADKLFVAFQRLHQASEFPGTGIGLATVSRAIARHRGRLWAQAAVGKGATFFFTLPK